VAPAAILQYPEGGVVYRVYEIVSRRELTVGLFAKRLARSRDSLIPSPPDDEKTVGKSAGFTAPPFAAASNPNRKRQFDYDASARDVRLPGRATGCW